MVLPAGMARHGMQALTADKKSLLVASFGTDMIFRFDALTGR